MKQYSGPSKRKFEWVRHKSKWCQRNLTRQLRQRQPWLNRKSLHGILLRCRKGLFFQSCNTSGIWKSLKKPHGACMLSDEIVTCCFAALELYDRCLRVHSLSGFHYSYWTFARVRAELLGLKSCEVLNQNQLEPPLCLSYSKNVIFSPNADSSSLPPSLPPLLSLSNALPLSVLALELLEKCAPLKRRSLIWVQKKSSKSPRLTRFPPSPKTLRYLGEHIHQEWSE